MKKMTAEEFKLLNEHISKDISRNAKEPYDTHSEESSSWLFVQRLNKFRNQK